MAHSLRKTISQHLATTTKQDQPSSQPQRFCWYWPAWCTIPTTSARPLISNPRAG